MIGAAYAAPPNPESRIPAPDMQPTNIHRLITSQEVWLNTSQPITADELAGRIILLDFWTYCCINCMHVIPDLQYLEEKFGDKLTVIGVHSAKFKNERDTENIRQAILRYGIHHPVVNDFDFRIWQGFGVRAWPTFVLVNPTGMIEEMYSGEGNREEVERDVTRLIEKYGEQLVTSPLPIALEESKAPPSVLSFPGKLAFDGEETLFVSDSGNQRIVMMTLEGQITGSIGSGKTGSKDGSFEEASFNTPQGIAYQDGALTIADTNNHMLRAANLKTRQVTTLAGTGRQGYERSARHAPALATPLASPWDVEFYPDNGHIAIAMAGTHQLWSYDIVNNTVSVIAGNGRESIDDGHMPFNSLSQPSGLSAVGSKLYFVDSETSSLRVLEDGKITTLIGTGLFDFGYAEGKRGEALMQHAIGVYATPPDVYIADSYNHSIRRYDPATGYLHNFAGHGVRGNKDGVLAEAEFNEPNDVLQIGDKLYVADTNNHAIRVIDLTAKKVSTLPVQEEQSAVIAYSDTLPNLDKTEAATLAPGAAIAIGLKPNWKINDEAPSYLALFDAAKKPVASFGLQEVKKQSVTLPMLAEGEYRLQGTLYYCEDREGAQCLIKSFDVPVMVKAGGEKSVTLPLN